MFRDPTNLMVGRSRAGAATEAYPDPSEGLLPAESVRDTCRPPDIRSMFAEHAVSLAYSELVSIRKVARA